MNTYFVCYVVNGVFYDSTVSIPVTKGQELITLLRNAVHPDKVGDPSDGMKAQRSIDCTIVNFILLDQ